MMVERPFFSIVIPTYERPSQLSDCLASLARLDYPRERFEVVVVNDGGKQPLDALVGAFRHRLNLKLLGQSNAGPAAARNAGAAQAAGEYLAFTDDDCLPEPLWLRALADRYVETPDCLCGGRTLNALHDNLPSATSQTIIDVVYAHFNREHGEARFFASNNIAVPAARFRALGGFDVSFKTSEDREFCDRWLRHGLRMVYVPEAVVRHAHALTPRTLWRQHFGYGRGAFRFHRLRQKHGAGRFKPDPEFYWKLLSQPFSQARGRRALTLAALMLWSQAANTAGFIYEGMKNRE